MKFLLRCRHMDFKVETEFNENDPREIISHFVSFMLSSGYMQSTVDSALLDYLQDSDYTFEMKPNGELVELAAFRQKKSDPSDAAGTEDEIS